MSLVYDNDFDIGKSVISTFPGAGSEWELSQGKIPVVE